MAGLLESLAQIAPSVMSGFGNKTETFDRVRGIRQENEAQADQKERKERLRKFVQLMTQTDGPVTAQKLYQNAQAAGIDPDDAAKVGMDFVNFRKAAAPEKQKFSRALGNGMTQQVEVPPDSALLGSGKWMPGTLSGSPRKPELIDGVNPATGKPMYATLGQNGTISQLQGIIPQEHKGGAGLKALQVNNPDGTQTTTFVPEEQGASYNTGRKVDTPDEHYEYIRKSIKQDYKGGAFASYDPEIDAKSEEAVQYAIDFYNKNKGRLNMDVLPQTAIRAGKNRQKTAEKVQETAEKLPMANRGNGYFFNQPNKEETVKLVQKMAPLAEESELKQILIEHDWSPQEAAEIIREAVGMATQPQGPPSTGPRQPQESGSPVAQPQPQSTTQGTSPQLPQGVPDQIDGKPVVSSSGPANDTGRVFKRKDGVFIQYDSANDRYVTWTE